MIAADRWLAARAPGCPLGAVVEALGARAAGLDELWANWGRVRPVLLADA